MCLIAANISKVSINTVHRLSVQFNLEIKCLRNLIINDRHECA